MASTKKLKPKLRYDWEAVERDFATGQFTDGELAAKHKLSREAIVRRRKRDQKADPRRWQRDLSKQVQAATQALLLYDEVKAGITSTITAGHSASAVLSAAETGKAVILGHRDELRRTKAVVAGLLRELGDAALLDEHRELLAKIVAGEDADPAETAAARKAVIRALGLGGRVSSVKALAEAITKLHQAERVAFGLKDDDASDNKQQTLPEALAAFIGQIHSSGGSRLPFRPWVPK